MISYRVRNLLRNFFIGAVAGAFVFWVGCVFLRVTVEWLVPKLDVTTWASLGFAAVLGWLACQRHCEHAVQVGTLITPSFYADIALYLGTLTAGGVVAAYFANTVASAQYVAYGVGQVFFLVYMIRLVGVILNNTMKSVG